MFAVKCVHATRCGLNRYAVKRSLCLSHLHSGTMSDKEVESKPTLVSICQITATSDKESNFEMCKTLIEKSKSMGAQMIFLPESCDFIGDSIPQTLLQAETLHGDLLSRYRDIAKRLKIWLSLGFHRKDVSDVPEKIYNSHTVISDAGEVIATYDKMHLFDLDIRNKIRLKETDHTIPGSCICPPVSTPVGNVGLMICYDLRFPEQSLILRNEGAEILTYPSVFTVPTGQAHWEMLLRCRAVENQCYVIAAAQVGNHNPKRSSYGHSMIVDPWGTVIAECKEGVDICLAQIDLKFLKKIRSEMPIMSHRRTNLYDLTQLHESKEPIDSVEDYEFGHVRIKPQFVFYKSSCSIAIVNIKCVVPGHVLVLPLRKVKRFEGLTEEEVSDLFVTVQKVEQVIEKHFGSSSSTISIQDGCDAGQTVEHVHVHVLPRKPGDFKKNDEIYTELEKHDKNHPHISELRSEEEMKSEADVLRKYFT